MKRYFWTITSRHDHTILLDGVVGRQVSLSPKGAWRELRSPDAAALRGPTYLLDGGESGIPDGLGDGLGHRANHLDRGNLLLCDWTNWTFRHWTYLAHVHAVDVLHA